MSDTPPATLAERLRAVFALDSGALAVEFEGQAATWGDLAAGGAGLLERLRAAGVPREAVVGWVARNRPAMVAAFAALVQDGRTVAPLRPNQPAAAFAAELRAQRLAAIVGMDDDWPEAAVAAARETGTLGLRLEAAAPFAADAVSGVEAPGPGPHRAPMPGVVMERLTSGTTGPPKRIPVTQEVLIPALIAGEGGGKAGDGTLRLKSSPAILLKPFSHAGGLFGLLLALYQARPMVLFEKFAVDPWVQAVRRYRPKSASLVPAMIRMILEEGPPKGALDSLLAVRAGTAPLDPRTQLEFEARYGVPILIDYGAAEFIGGVAGWSLADHRAFAEGKRGSVGRAKPDVSLRVVSPETFEVLPAGETGLLEIRSVRFGPDWHRTQDLAELDAEGFVWLRGRADDAINRGGFKVLPDEVAAVLRRFPGVRDAAVAGAADARLGEVPVAVLELVDGTALDEAALDRFVRAALPAYMAPVRYKVVDELPRTASLKVSRPDLKALVSA